jgi:hypothetical protein
MSLNEIFYNLDKWAEEKKAGIEAVGRNIAAKSEAKAKTDRTWKDRTANARQGLHAGTQWDSATALIIYLAHSVDYGPYLELCNDGKYAIIEKTLNSFRKELLDSVKAILNA